MTVVMALASSANMIYASVLFSTPRCLVLLPAYTLLAQKVPDLHSPVSQGDVDGKMRVTEAHLVQEALGDTSDQVLNVGAHSADAGQLQKANNRQHSVCEHICLKQA